MSKVELSVPFVKQKVDYCGPASLAMVLQFYGLNIDQNRIGNTLCAQFMGVTMEELAGFAEKEAFTPKISELSINELSALLDEGVPIIVLQKKSLKEQSGHFRVVVGYDSGRKRIIYHDPDVDAYMDVSAALFEEVWKLDNAQNISLVIRPYK